MSLTLKYNNPAYPEGAVLGIAGLGEVKNGESKELTEEEERTFLSMRGVGIKQAMEGDEMASVEGEPSVEEPEAEPSEEEAEGAEPEEEKSAEESGA